MARPHGLEDRERTDAHIAYIRANKSVDIEFAELLERVYAHHPAVFPGKRPTGHASPRSGHFSDLPTSAYLAAHFYAENYEPPTLHYSDPTGVVLAVSDFIEERIFPAPDGQRNHMTFLLGEVGSGKTAFVN